MNGDYFSSDQVRENRADSHPVRPVQRRGACGAGCSAKQPGVSRPLGGGGGGARGMTVGQGSPNPCPTDCGPGTPSPPHPSG